MVREGYIQTDVGVFPKDWEVASLGDIGDPKMCKRVLKEQTKPQGDIPFFKIGTFGGEPDAFISRELFESFRCRFSYPNIGDILLSAAGTIGRTVIFDGKDAYFQDSNIVWIDNNEKKIYNKYLYYVYHATKWKTADGGTVSRLYNDLLKKTVIVIPPLPEQEAIASALSDVDELISNLEKLIEKKKNIKHGVMQELLTGKRRLSGFTGEWTEMVIGKNGYLQKGSINPMLQPEDYFSEYSMPAFDETRSPAKVQGKTMHSNRTVISGRVLLFNKLNVRQKRIWLVDKCEENAVCSGEFLPYCSDSIDLRLLAQILYTDEVTADFIGMSTGTSNSQKRITPKAFLDYSLYLPTDMEEQKALADIFDDMDQEISTLQRQVDKYRQLKQGMMQKLLTGEIRLI